MKKEIKLYNVLFPIWLLMLFPVCWLFIIPGNFIIDSLVLIISMYALKINDKKQFYKKNILKIFIFTFTMPPNRLSVLMPAASVPAEWNRSAFIRKSISTTVFSTANPQLPAKAVSLTFHATVPTMKWRVSVTILHRLAVCISVLCLTVLTI